MAEQVEVVIASLRIENYEQVVKAQMAVEGLRKQAKEYKAQLEQNVISEEEYVKLMAENTKATVEAKANLKDLNYETKVQNDLTKASSGSINEMRARLKALTKEYNALSEEQRNSPMGKAMKDQIKGLSDDLKGLEGGLGDFRRNVGNYSNSILDALGNVSPAIEQAVDVARGLGPAMGDAQKGVQVAANSFKSLRGAIAASGIGLLVLAVAGLVTYLTQFDGALDGVEQALAGLRAAIEPVIGWLGQLGKNVINLFSNIGIVIKETFEAAKQYIQGNFDAAAKATQRMNKALAEVKDGVKNLIPSFEGLGNAMADAYKKGALLAQQMQDLEDAESELAFDRIKIEKEIAQLEKQAEDRARTKQQRLESLRKAQELALKLGDREVQNIKERNRIELAQLLQRANLNELIKKSGEYTSNEIAAIKERMKALTEDHQLQEDFNSAMQTMATIQQKQVDAEQKRTDTILKYNAMSGKLRKAEMDEQKALTAAREAATKRLLELNVEIAQSDEQRLVAKRRLIEFEMNQELKTVGNNAELQKAIRLKYDQEYSQLDEDAHKARQAKRKEYFDQVKAQLQEEQDETLANLERNYRLQNLAIDQALANGDIAQADAEAMRLTRQGEYLNALLEQQKKYGLDTVQTEEQIAKRTIDINTKAAKQREAIAKAEIEVARNVVNSLSTAFAILSNNAEQGSDFQKGMALANIAISTAESIAGIVRIASTTSPDPITYAVQLTAGIASVLSNIAQASSILNAANTPQAPTPQRFAKGGIIGGKLHSNGGTLIEAEKGEMVMSRGAVAMFGPQLAQMNAAGGGQGMGASVDAAKVVSQQMANQEASFRKMASMLPAPVVNVRDISRTNDDAYRTKNRASIGVVNRSVSSNP